MLNEKVTFDGGSGHKLAARLDTPSRPPIGFAILAHCFTCSKNSRAATTIAAALVEEGFGVLRFDFTALGNSEGDFEDTTFGTNIDDLLAASAWLSEHHGDPQLLIGHSLGGAAVLSAAHRLDSVKAVATIGAPADPTHVTNLLRDGIEEIRANGKAEVDIGGRPFVVRKEFLDDLERHSPTERLATLGKALMIFHSPIDNTVGVDNAAELFTAAKHPKSFVSLDDADHLLTRRSDGAYVGEVLAAWARRYIGESTTEPGASGQVADGAVRVSERGFNKFANLVETDSHHLHADEPLSVGGANSGPNPYDFLLAGLGACTSMTLRMYADRKEIPLEHVSVDLSHDRIHAKDCEDCESSTGMVDVMRRSISLTGPLSDEHRSALLRIADRCPVHKTLTGEIRVETSLAGEATGDEPAG